MVSARGRFSQRGSFPRIPDKHGLLEIGLWFHRSCGNRLTPLILEMRTRGTPLDGTVESSCCTIIEPDTRASSDRRREAVGSLTASYRQPGRWTTSHLGRPQRLGDAR